MADPDKFAAFRSGEHGSSVVEFAILAPVFLLMLFGMVGYAIYFGAAHSIQQLAADAARVSVAGLDEAERTALVQGYLQRNAGDYLLINPQRLQVAVGDKSTDPDQYQVTLTYDASALPIWDLSPVLPLPQRSIVQRYSIRKGGT